MPAMLAIGFIGLRVLNPINPRGHELRTMMSPSSHYIGSRVWGLGLRDCRNAPNLYGTRSLSESLSLLFTD